MKRIITVCDSHHFSGSALSLSCYLARLRCPKVIGAFPRLSGSEDLPICMPFANTQLVGALIDSQARKSCETQYTNSAKHVQKKAWPVKRFRNMTTRMLSSE